MAAQAMGVFREWYFYSDVVDLAAGATGALVAAQGAGRITRLVGLWGSADIAGTVVLKDGTTARSGTINLASTAGWILQPIPHDDVPYFAWMESSPNAAINITTVYCTIDGVVLYAVTPSP